jgi:hypothetical protein
MEALNLNILERKIYLSSKEKDYIYSGGEENKNGKELISFNLKEEKLFFKFSERIGEREILDAFFVYETENDYLNGEFRYLILKFNYFTFILEKSKSELIKNTLKAITLNKDFNNYFNLKIKGYEKTSNFLDVKEELKNEITLLSNNEIDLESDFLVFSLLLKKANKKLNIF